MNDDALLEILPDHRVALDRLVQHIAENFGRDEALYAVTATALGLVDGADSADILTMHGHEQHHPAVVATGRPPPTLEDNVVEDLRQLTPADQTVFCCNDFEHDGRWSGVPSVIRSNGVRSIMLFELQAGGALLGTLIFLGRSPGAFTPCDERVGRALAWCATLALKAAVDYHALEVSLDAHDVIERAKGMVMERLSLDAVQADHLLRQLAKESGNPSFVVAQRLIEHGPIK